MRVFPGSMIRVAHEERGFVSDAVEGVIWHRRCFGEVFAFFKHYLCDLRRVR